MSIKNHVVISKSPRTSSVRALTACAAAALAFGLSSTASAAIPVGAAGSTIQSFATRPAAADWSTLTWSGTAADIIDVAGLDAAVQTLAASAITTQVGTSGTNPPSANALARQNSALFALQTRPTTSVKGCVMMATLSNTSGGDINELEISYDFLMPAPGTEQVAGLRAYYSLTGLANSWTAIPAFCTATAGALKTTVTLSSAWTNATTMYVLWADDNAIVAGDSFTLIDNVRFGKPGTGAYITAFDFGLPAYGPAVVDSATPTNISINVPAGTDVSALTPTFTLSPGATCDKVSGGPTTYDFSSPQTYNVTSADTSLTTAYTVTVNFKTVVDISTILTPGPQGTSQGIVIDSTVGTGNFGRMVGSTQTYWGSTGFTVPVMLNENTLIIDSGGGNTMNAKGPISGNGIVRFQDGGSNPIRVQGAIGNTYTGSTVLAYGTVSLEKISGDAVRGAVSVGTSSTFVWAASNQINDASDVTLASGSILNLAGYSDTINELHMVTNSSVQTGGGGVLKVAKLFINGEQQPEVAKIAGDGYVTGSGYIEVGSSGPPVLETAPDAPATPTPADLSTSAHPAFLAKLDWADCARATSYDIYFWDASGSKPGTPTANVSLSEYTLPAQVLSLTTYMWQVVAKNAVGQTAGPEWTFTTVDRRDISNATTPGDPANPNNGVRIDIVVGTGNVARLVGTTQTFWTEGFTDSVNLNGNTFYIDSGGNQNRIANGAIFGTGVVIYRSTGPLPGRVVSGSEGNTYTGPTTVSGIVTLAKTAGDALCSGPITLNSGGSLLVWAANNQINDASDLSLTSAGATLNLAGFTDTIASLTLATGTTVETGTGGVLTVGALTVGGNPMANGSYTNATNPEFVSGTGSVVVGAAGSPYDTWAATHAGGQSAGQDYDNDGVSNGVEYFMGSPDGFTANPGIISGKVTWPQVGTVTSYGVEVSDNLVDWSAANPADIDTTSVPGSVIYTLPTGATKKFCRLVVTP